MKQSMSLKHRDLFLTNACEMTRNPFIFSQKYVTEQTADVEASDFGTISDH